VYHDVDYLPEIYDIFDHTFKILVQMAKANYLNQIRKRMDDIQQEYTALSEAYQLLSSASGTRGKKATLPGLGEAIVSTVSKSKRKPGRPGRPAGAKSKAGSKKPGPKPSAAAPKKAGRPAGRPAKSGNAKSAKSGGRRNKNISGKIVEIVSKANRFTTNSNITDKIVSLYPGKDRAELGKYISVILANMKARKELSVITVDAKGKKMRSGLWGLPSWFDGNKPKADYLK